ncbi:MAG: VWA domain-containing protein, partial [Polyangiaceae bacterium]|nr:VWA domain-containing protein [Polyangiaceae bacterium]
AVDSYCCSSSGSWDSICVGEISSVCGLSCPLAANSWTQACVYAVQSVCGAKCGTAPVAPAACSHNPCTQGGALNPTCNSCVASVCAADSYCCNNTWDANCVSEVNSVCGLGCPIANVPPQPAPPESGQCKGWLPGQTDPACTGADLSLGVPCDDTILVCNHGQTAAPAGVDIIAFPGNSGQYPKCAPDQTQVTKTCTTTAPVPPGECISVSCPAITDLSELMVNPPGGNHKAECKCEDNWSVYKQGVSCGPPSCAGDVQTATFKPVNLYFMVDRSGSMGGNKWTGATNALKGFFQDPGSAGIGAALEFFPLASGGTFGDGCPSSNGTGCTATPCSNPMVTLNKLLAAGAPTDTQEAALVTGVNAVAPGGNTPTYPALDGALTWAINNQNSNANEQYVVVLVTDGDPTQCNTSNSAIATLAANAFNNSGIRTYTIGMQGANIAALDQIAQSGGTGQAFVIQGTNSNNVEAQLIAAFQAIAGQNVSCSFSMPPAGSYDPNDITVSFTPSSGPPATGLAQRTDSSQCGTGWYYDNNANPTGITLCPSTCAAAQGDPGSKVDYEIGCPKALDTTAYTQIYEANCPVGTKPQWGYFAYDSTDPGDSNIVFRARTADLQTGLASATFVPLVTAQSAPTDTQVCPMSGPSPCPVDLYIKMGTPDAKRRWLELEVTLNPTSNKLNSPTLNDWNITYSCPPGE